MTMADAQQNPFLTPSELPFQFPDFERITEEHFTPAFEHGMARQRAEVDAVTGSAEAPSFENTVVALERSGETLRRVSAVFFTLAGSNSTPAIQRLQAELAPKLAAHRDAIMLDPLLFARVRALYEQRESLQLDAESDRLLERYHRDGVRAGARLAEPQQRRLRELNAEISTLATDFSNRLLAETNDSAVVVDDPAQLAGLSENAVSVAAQAAATRGHDGAHLLTLVLPTGQPALASLTDRALRERLFTAAASRGSRGNANDTTSLVLRLARLRAERAQLLGYPDHASYVVETNTALTVTAVDAMLDSLTPAAVANADSEAELLQRAIDTTADHPHRLAAWDWAFYSERVRRERYDLDTAALRPYLELERVLHDGVFHAAGLLYGLSFTERSDIPTYHPDVRVFEVSDSDGSPLGLYGGDYYARASKRGGAWMNSFVSQSGLLGTRPVVLNTLNISRPADGEPTLLTFDEVTTLFHEFGHALHALFSDVRYPSFAGTSVPRDFVEYPSQVNEMWSVWPEILANYARHHETGEQLPADLLRRLLASQQYGEGFRTTEYLAAALLDQAWHRLGVDDRVTDVDTFEAEALAKAGVALEAVPPRYRSSYFAHIFSGGYAAAYYSYIWSEVLDADTVEWFKENGGLLRRNGDTFRRELLSRGGSMDELSAYRAFRGRDPEIGPLLERRGLTGT